MQHCIQKACGEKLKKSRPSLKEQAKQLFSKHSILQFFHSIIFVHMVGAFSGKATLWDFRREVANNLN